MYYRYVDIIKEYEYRQRKTRQTVGGDSKMPSKYITRNKNTGTDF